MTLEQRTKKRISFLARAKLLVRSGCQVSHEEWTKNHVDVGSSNSSGLEVQGRECTCQKHLGKTMVIHFSHIIDTSENVHVNVKDLLDISAQCLCKRVWKPSHIWFQSKCINFVWQSNDGVLLPVFWTLEEKYPYVMSDDLRKVASEIETIAGISETQAEILQRDLERKDKEMKTDLNRQEKKLNADNIKLKAEIEEEQKDMALRKAVLFGQLQRKSETEVQVEIQETRVKSLEKRIKGLEGVVVALSHSPAFISGLKLHTLDLEELSGLWDNLAKTQVDIRQESAKTQYEKTQLESKLNDVKQQEKAVRNEIGNARSRRNHLSSTKRKGQEISDALARVRMMLLGSRNDPGFVAMMGNFDQVVSELRDKTTKRKSQTIRNAAKASRNSQNDVTPQIQKLIDDLEGLKLKGLDLVKEIEQLNKRLVVDIKWVDECIKCCDTIKAKVDELVKRLEQAGQ